MVEYKYGELTENQFEDAIIFVRKQIFTLLLYADPNLQEKYKNYDVNKAFDTFLHKLGGMNSIFYEPPELVRVISILESAWLVYKEPTFDFQRYRSLVLEAGNLVLRIKKPSEGVD